MTRFFILYITSAVPAAGDLDAEASCWVWLSSFTSTHISAVKLRTRVLQKRCKQLEALAARGQWKALLLFAAASMHKAGLCKTALSSASDAPDAPVSSPGGGGAPVAELHSPAHEMLFLPALINKLLLMFIVIVLMLI